MVLGDTLRSPDKAVIGQTLLRAGILLKAAPDPFKWCLTAKLAWTLAHD